MKHMLLALSVVALAACSSTAKKDASPANGADSSAMKNQSAESAADGARLSGKNAGAKDMFGAPESGELLVVHFPFDSSTLTQEAQDNLRANAEFLRQNPEARIVVEGHTDERGADEYNLALGERRAKAVREYLTLLGIDSSRMQTVSYGSQQPAERGGDEDAFSKNRRASFRELN
jgi:peptidoglycan-associated lipoprotein